MDAVEDDERGCVGLVDGRVDTGADGAGLDVEDQVAVTTLCATAALIRDGTGLPPTSSTTAIASR